MTDLLAPAVIDSGIARTAVPSARTSKVPVADRTLRGALGRKVDESTSWDDEWIDAEIDENEARRRLAALRRGWKLIALAALALAGASWWFGKSAQTATATATIYITDDANGTRDDTVTAEILDARRRILVSREAIDVVTSTLTSSNVSAITAEIVPDTQLINLTVTALSSAGALAGVDALTAFYVQRTINLKVESVDRQLAILDEERTRLIAELDDRTAEWLAALRAEAPGSTAGAEHEMFGISNRIFFLEEEVFNLRTERALASGDVEIVDQSSAATPTGVSRWIFASGGLLAGALAAAAMLVLAASRDDRLHSLADIDDVTPHLAVLATLPIAAHTSAATESVRRLRHGLSARHQTIGKWKTVSIASVDSALLSSDLAGALAKSFVATGASVLAIDGDPVAGTMAAALGDSRLGPDVHSAVSVVRSNSNYRVAPSNDLGASLHKLLRTIETTRPAGGSNQLRFLGNETASRATVRAEIGPDDLSGILAAAATNHDLVVVNGGAALELADCVAWAAASDITVIAVQLGRTNRRDLMRVVTNMQFQGVSIAGLVVAHRDDDIGHRSPIHITEGNLGASL
ncbi:MAG: hypothetical protein ACKVHU_05765 [Acidimicrobiales bacterium]